MTFNSPVDTNALAQLMPHRRLVPAAVAHDARAETIIGRLCLNGHITTEEYDAAVKYREIIERYRMVIDAPSPNERSMSGVIVGPWGGSRVISDSEAKERKDKYNAAFEWVEEKTGHRGARTIAHALHDRADFVVAVLILVLGALCTHFGLTNSRKSANAINRR